MKYLFITLLGLLIWTGTQAQEYQEYHWEAKRERYPENGHGEESVTRLLQHTQYEYAYERSQSIIYQTVHQIVRVNNNEAIAQNNRIYIPVKDVIELVELHARTIGPDGKVTMLDKNNIKEVKDEESGQGYKIFAIEGARKGSEIEYYYTKKVKPNYFGRLFFQSDVPVEKASFKLICPSNLHFEFKSYNGFPEVKEVEAEDNNNVYEANAAEIPALQKEEFAIYDNNRQRLEFKLAYNDVRGTKRLFTWEEVGKQVKEGAYSLEKKETKDLEKWLEELPLNGLDNRSKVALIEDKVKKEFYIDDNGSQSNDISEMLSKKIGSKYGIFKLMANALKTLGIEHQIVLTNDRTEIAFDGDFDSYNYLSDYLIYLPETKEYLAPYHQPYRLGLTPSELTANAGLFIRNVKVKGYDVTVTEVGTIPALPYTENFDNLRIHVSFDPSLGSNLLEMERSFKGYQGSYMKSVMPYLEAKEKDEMLSDLIKYISPDADIVSKEFVQLADDWEEWSKPLIIRGKMKSSHFIENAGNTLLFKAGDLIGAQSELYQEEVRHMPVANPYNHGYKRTITIDVPAGYVIQNPEDLIIHESTTDENGRQIFVFSSTYELRDQQLIINIDEYYDQIFLPKEKFQEFRKVINAAADFNKVVLVLKAHSN